MVDFIISKSRSDKKIRFKRPIDNAKLAHHFYTIKDINIDCVSFKPESQFKYEDDAFFYLICGDAFHSYDSDRPFSRLSAFSISGNNQLLDLPVKNIRGHYIIIKINKRSQEIIAINDVFGFIPLYYGILENSFILSTSLSILNHFNFELDELVLYEKILFQHSLSDFTLIKNICTLEPARFLSLRKNKFIVEKYHDWLDYFQHASNNPFNIDHFTNFFNEICLHRSENSTKNLITLTGGHDGRAVLSSFFKNRLDVETFSFGRRSSENTFIPELISNRLKFNHRSIYLEDEFEETYFNNALDTLWHSDGELVFEQQSNIYAAKKISEYFSINYTGLVAGEILGPIHLIKDYLTPLYHEYVYKETTFKNKSAFEKLNLQNYIIDATANKFETSIAENLNNKITLNNRDAFDNIDHLFYLYDLIQNGFRKFYGYQKHLMRFYLVNIPIFYDLDLLTLLIHSDYHHTYKNSFKSKVHRQNSRSIQCSIIRRNSKELSMIPLDRGYPPYWTVHPTLKYFRILPYYFRKYKLNMGITPLDFISPKWSRHIYRTEIINTSSISSSFLDLRSIEAYLKKLAISEKQYSFEINRLISIMIYVNTVLKK